MIGRKIIVTLSDRSMTLSPGYDSDFRELPNREQVAITPRGPVLILGIMLALSCPG